MLFFFVRFTFSAKAGVGFAPISPGKVPSPPRPTRPSQAETGLLPSILLPSILLHPRRQPGHSLSTKYQLSARNSEILFSIFLISRLKPRRQPSPPSLPKQNKQTTPKGAADAGEPRFQDRPQRPASIFEAAGGRPVLPIPREAADSSLPLFPHPCPDSGWRHTPCTRHSPWFYLSPEV